MPSRTQWSRNIKREQVKAEIRAQEERIATSGIRAYEAIGVTYTHHLCSLMTEPLFVHVGDDILLTVASKGALAKSLDKATEFPNNRDTVFSALNASRKVYVFREYQNLKGAKHLIRKPQDVEHMTINDLFTDTETSSGCITYVTEHARQAGEQVLFTDANIPMMDQARGYSTVLQSFDNSREVLATTATLIGLLGCCNSNDHAVNFVLCTLMWRITGVLHPSALSADIDDVFRKGMPIRHDTLNAGIGASFIAPTGNGFTLITTAGNRNRDKTSLRQQMYEIMLTRAMDNRQVVNNAKALARDLINSGHIYATTTTFPPDTFSRAVQLKENISEMERNMYDALCMKLRIDGAQDFFIANAMVCPPSDTPQGPSLPPSELDQPEPEQ